jgi:mannose-6-phosphate isomerase-like protein (cupin superfamily)
VTSVIGPHHETELEMDSFATLALPEKPTVTAPDGSDVRVLLRLAGGSMAHFELGPGLCSSAVKHKTVEELWYVVGGQAEMWRSQDGREEVMLLKTGMSLSIPLDTSFQFRTVGSIPFAAIGVTMPPWPSQDEAVHVAGPWQATPQKPMRS